LSTIYINPDITVYLISVGLGVWGKDARICACVNAFIKFCWVAKVRENSFTKQVPGIALYCFSLEKLVISK